MEQGAAQRRRSSSASSSPEFEFWMVRNPSCAPPELLTADELIVDGVLLPLHLLSLHRSHPSPPPPPLPPSDPPPAPVAESTSGSRRWTDIFRAAVDKKPEEKEREKEKEKEKRDRRSSGGGSASAADLININLNIWPFSRSHSAGNAVGRLRSIASRKVNSAPCSRSNSRGESSGGGCTGRRFASNPSRGGVHLGRSGPVWKLRRTGMGTKEIARNSNAAACSGDGGGVRLINLNVNSCIGHQNQVSCRDDDSDGLVAGGGRAGDGGGSNGSVFSFRALFSKKVY